MLSAYLLDDEQLAVDRLKRMLKGLVTIIGSSIDPLHAVSEIDALRPELLFLDIQMPELDGFSVLRRLEYQPLVIFTTAYDQYALQAFETNSIAYLLKPVEAAKLSQALDKISALRGGQDVQKLFHQLAMRSSPSYPERISSKSGDKIEFLDLSRVTHFYAEDKLTFAATDTKSYIIDQTISELEMKLDPAHFFRIHRSTLVNLDYVAELYSYFSGKMLVRLKDARKSELITSKERVRELKDKLGL